MLKKNSFNLDLDRSVALVTSNRYQFGSFTRDEELGLSIIESLMKGSHLHLCIKEEELAYLILESTEFSGLNNEEVLIHKSRVDLQENFDLNESDGVRRYTRWLKYFKYNFSTIIFLYK